MSSLLETRALEMSNQRNPGHVETHHARLRRVLELVQKCHGKFEVPIARRLTGWEERSIQRYVRTLRDLGLIVQTRDTLPYKWALTQAGKDELRG